MKLLPWSLKKHHYYSRMDANKEQQNHRLLEEKTRLIDRKIINKIFFTPYNNSFTNNKNTTKIYSKPYCACTSKCERFYDRSKFK